MFCDGPPVATVGPVGPRASGTRRLARQPPTKASSTRASSPPSSVLCSAAGVRWAVTDRRPRGGGTRGEGGSRVGEQVAGADLLPLELLRRSGRRAGGRGGGPIGLLERASGNRGCDDRRWNQRDGRLRGRKLGELSPACTSGDWPSAAASVASGEPIVASIETLRSESPATAPGGEVPVASATIFPPGPWSFTPMVKAPPSCCPGEKTTFPPICRATIANSCAASGGGASGSGSGAGGAEAASSASNASSPPSQIFESSSAVASARPASCRDHWICGCVQRVQRRSRAQQTHQALWQ